MLLAPSFSRRDEAAFFRLLDRLARVLGHLPFAALLKMMGPAMKRMPLPADRREVLAAEFRKNDPRIVRRAIHCYFQYLDRYGSVASRLCEADVPAWVVHGERGDGGITDDERRTLKACPRIRVITLPGASYFTPNEEPALVAKLVVEAGTVGTPGMELPGHMSLRSLIAPAGRAVNAARAAVRTLSPAVPVP